MTATIRASMLHPLLAILKEQGLDARASCGLDAAMLRDPSARLPFGLAVNAIEAAALRCGLPSIGLYMAELRRLDDVGDYYPLAGSAPSVLCALRDFCAFAALISPALGAMVNVDTGRDRVVFAIEINLEAPARLVQIMEYLLALVARMMRTLSGGAVQPVALTFRHSPRSHGLDYSHYFGAPVLFRQPLNTLEFSLPEALAPLPGHDDSLYRCRREALAASFEQRFSFAADVLNRTRLLILMSRGDLESLAASYGMGVRSLQRRLEGHGTTFAEVLECARRRLFAEMILDPRTTLGVISLHLGYANQSTLHKACLRWYGLTPSAVRKRALEGKRETYPG
ncbi:AraC family transcriptional regulator [Paludibacterium paludis]|uniref:AraC family transcriptional regulator n=1 Tax=Paludibacterium paludis TaxID=1225769 RepID=A0A918P2C0_9NEIS|nr:AraC family transcriptional regulator [Paludibacterium paludis]GGY11942.1 AraC family transcriptional regulator [Paludibacterium paludis]